MRHGDAVDVASAEMSDVVVVLGTVMCPAAVRRIVVGRTARVESGSAVFGVSHVGPGPKASKDYEGNTKGEIVPGLALASKLVTNI